jgi:pyruvate dehydrogenase E1 component alpha subunit
MKSDPGRLYREMVRIRRFEEKCAELYGEMKIRGFLHLYVGEEAIATGVMSALTPEDGVITAYRDHGHALARGVPMREVMAEMFGKSEGCSRGRGGSMHLFHLASRFYGGSAIVGGGIPIAVGLALADLLQNRKRVTACFFGEGAVAEGVFHESMNLAALWKVPVLFLCENNRYAMGTAIERELSKTDILEKVRGYGIPANRVDGMDVRAVAAGTKRAVDAVRRGDGPAFLEFETYRFRAHSMYDPELYRSKEEVNEWKKRDPLLLEEGRLREDSGFSDQERTDIERKIDQEITESVRFAEGGALEPVSMLFSNVYKRGSSSWRTEG